MTKAELLDPQKYACPKMSIWFSALWNISFENPNENFFSWMFYSMLSSIFFWINILTIHIIWFFITKCTSWLLVMKRNNLDGKALCSNEMLKMVFSLHYSICQFSSLSHQLDGILCYLNKYIFQQFGGSRYEDVQHTKLMCTVFDEIECFGNRSFLADKQPCLK